MKKFYLKIYAIVFFLCYYHAEKNLINYDVVVYGGTSAVVAAAVQATRLNKSVIIIEPGTEEQLGGLTSGGLGRTDFGNKKVIRGISLKFYKDINKNYLNDSN